MGVHSYDPMMLDVSARVFNKACLIVRAGIALHELAGTCSHDVSEVM